MFYKFVEKHRNHKNKYVYIVHYYKL